MAIPNKLLLLLLSRYLLYFQKLKRVFASIEFQE